MQHAGDQVEKMVEMKGKRDEVMLRIVDTGNRTEKEQKEEYFSRTCPNVRKETKVVSSKIENRKKRL